MTEPQSVLTIVNTQTETVSEFYFNTSDKVHVYEAIRRCMQEQKDLSIVLTTGILMIPSKVVQESVLSIEEHDSTIYPLNPVPIDS